MHEQVKGCLVSPSNTLVAPTQVPSMGGKKSKPEGGKQVNFRCPDALNARLEAVALGLGLDVSNFLRMLLIKHLDTYEQEVEVLRQRKKPKG